MTMFSNRTSINARPVPGYAPAELPDLAPTCAPGGGMQGARRGRTALSSNPHLTALVERLDTGALTHEQADLTSRIARFHVQAKQRPRNMELQEPTPPADCPMPAWQQGIAMPAMTRQASFMLSAGILQGLDDVIARIGRRPARPPGQADAAIDAAWTDAASAIGTATGAAPADVADQGLLQAGLVALRKNCDLQLARAALRAGAGERTLPLTFAPEKFRVFLDKNLRLLQGVVDGCQRAGVPRTTALEDVMTELAQRYMAAAQVAPLIGRLRVRFVADGAHGLRWSRPGRGLPTLDITLATGGIDGPHTNIDNSLRRAGLGNFLRGVERRQPATRQAAAYLQILFQQLTRFEEWAGRSEQRVPEYEGDPVLGDTIAQRQAALQPVRRLAACMQQQRLPFADTAREDRTAARRLDAAITDPELRAWLQRGDAERSLAALAEPGERLGILQEERTRQALLRTATFRIAS